MAVVLLSAGGAAAAAPVEQQALTGVGAPGPAAERPAGPEDADGLVVPPVAAAPLVVHPFRAPAQAWSAGHRGVDLVLGVGEPVLAPADGEVVFAGTVVGRGVVTIRHRDGLRTSLEPVDPRVAVGDQVRRGEVVGTLAGTASHCVPRACLHWGVRDGSTYLDPITLLRGGGPVVLLPIGGRSPPKVVRPARPRSAASAAGPSPPCASARSETR